MTGARADQQGDTRASAPPRLAALDGLRLVAALAVLAFHYTATNNDQWGNPSSVEFPTLSDVTRYGYLGVELFFIISGFVILMTAYQRPLPVFVASRISRLYPAYWAAVVLTVLLHTVWDGGRHVDAIDSLVNLTMVQEAWGISNVQGSFWTLWIELCFYLLMGIFIVVGMTRPRIVAFAVLWPVLAEMAWAADSDLLDALLITSFAPYFAGGMLLYLIHREGPDLVLWLGLGLNVILGVRRAARYGASRAPDHSDVPISMAVVCVIVVLLFAIVYACTTGPLARLDWSWLTVAGALTYPLYLVHEQFGYAIFDLLSGRVDSYAVLALATLSSLALAWLIHRWVEQPLHRPMRRRLRDALERG